MDTENIIINIENKNPDTEVKKSFIDGMTPRQSLFMGVSWGVAIVCAVGFFVLLIGRLPERTKLDDSAGKNNIINNKQNTQEENKKEGDATKISPVTGSDHIRGDKSAKVTLIEYSDFQCPYCNKLEPTLEKILIDYNGKVRLVYRSYPLISIHQYAQKAAEAGECAADQGKFWEMHDKMFASQPALAVTNLKSYAKDLGLNQTQFDSCLDSGKYASRVNQQSTEAEAAGLTGTPGTFINNQFINGAYPYETFKSVIDGLIKN